MGSPNVDNQSLTERRMNDDQTGPGTGKNAQKLTDAARRALAEAEERRRNEDASSAEKPREVGGRAGPDPVRYGDWEKDGIVSDF